MYSWRCLKFPPNKLKGKFTCSSLGPGHEGLKLTCEKKRNPSNPIYWVFLCYSRQLQGVLCPAMCAAWLMGDDRVRNRCRALAMNAGRSRDTHGTRYLTAMAWWLLWAPVKTKSHGFAGFLFPKFGTKASLCDYKARLIMPINNWEGNCYLL